MDKNVVKYVDHTLLTQTATWEEIKQICDDGMKYKTASVCIPASYVKQASEYVDGKLAICTVIGFPLGANTAMIKAAETAEAYEMGCDEFDMVINVGQLKSGNWEYVKRDIEAVVAAARGKTVKVAGRLMSKRGQGKVMFCDLQDSTGRIQLFVKIDEMGEEEFKLFDNSGMQMQHMGNDFGEEIFRLPVFDVKVSAQSKTIYTQNSQNELAVSLYNLGVFNPGNVDQSLLLLDTMDFEGKDELSAKISQMGTIYQIFAQVSQIALGLAQQYDPMAADMLAQIIMGRAGQPMVTPAAGAGEGAARAASAGVSDAVQGRKGNGEEIKQVRDARARAQSAAEVK